MSSEEQKIAGIMRRMRALQDGGPQKGATGRHEFLKKMCQSVHASKNAGRGFLLRMSPQQVTHWTLARHGILWAGRCLREQAEWARQAQLRVAERTAANREEFQSLTHQLDLLESQLAELADKEGPITMSSASLTAVELARLDNLVTDPSFRVRA